MKVTYTLDEKESIAKALLDNAKTKVLFFHGEIGTGKTTLIQSLVKSLGGNELEVNSPTFSLVNEYEVKNDLVYHFDFYRINQEEEAYDIGFEDYVSKNHWIFIEWPLKISNLLPFNGKNVYLVRNNDDSRTLKLE